MCVCLVSPVASQQALEHRAIHPRAHVFTLPARALHPGRPAPAGGRGAGRGRSAPGRPRARWQQRARRGARPRCCPSWRGWWAGRAGSPRSALAVGAAGGVRAEQHGGGRGRGAQGAGVRRQGRAGLPMRAGVPGPQLGIGGLRGTGLCREVSAASSGWVAQGTTVTGGKGTYLCGPGGQSGGSWEPVCTPRPGCLHVHAQVCTPVPVPECVARPATGAWPFLCKEGGGGELLPRLPSGPESRV